MADPPKPKGGNVLTEKWGPLPVWAWALGGGALAVGIWRWRQAKAAASQAAPAALGGDTGTGYTGYGMSGYGFGGGGGGTLGGTPATGGISYGQPPGVGPIGVSSQGVPPVQAVRPPTIPSYSLPQPGGSLNVPGLTVNPYTPGAGGNQMLNLNGIGQIAAATGGTNVFTTPSGAKFKVTSTPGPNGPTNTYTLV